MEPDTSLLYLPLIPILSQLNPVHTLASYLILLLPSHLCHGFPIYQVFIQELDMLSVVCFLLDDM
jgi:hypothetical protein